MVTLAVEAYKSLNIRYFGCLSLWSSLFGQEGYEHYLFVVYLMMLLVAELV
jgi:hypothetical protein